MPEIETDWIITPGHEVRSIKTVKQVAQTLAIQLSESLAANRAELRERKVQPTLKRSRFKDRGMRSATVEELSRLRIVEVPVTSAVEAEVIHIFHRAGLIEHKQPTELEPGTYGTINVTVTDAGALAFAVGRRRGESLTVKADAVVDRQARRTPQRPAFLQRTSDKPIIANSHSRPWKAAKEATGVFYTATDPAGPPFVVSLTKNETSASPYTDGWWLHPPEGKPVYLDVPASKLQRDGALEAATAVIFPHTLTTATKESEPAIKPTQGRPSFLQGAPSPKHEVPGHGPTTAPSISM